MNSLEPYKKQCQRIPQEKQQCLVKLVFKDQKSIKEAANILKIIYASAKSIISRFRNRKILQNPVLKKNAKRCGYRKLMDSQQSRIKIKSSCGCFYNR